MKRPAQSQALRMAVLIASISAPMAAFAQTPWLPAPDAKELTFSYVNQKADTFKPGTATGNLPATLKQDTYSLSFSYGMSDALALDAQIGRAKSDFIKAPGLAPDGGLSGNTDSRLGLRYRVLDDLAADPITLTLGVAGILKGNYKTGALPAIGDGVNAFEVSAAVGKAITSNLSLYGVLGYRDRGSPVPNENFYKLGATLNITPQFFAAADYQKIDAKGGLDIGGPGFSPARFPEVQEDYSLSSITLGYRITPSVSAALQFGDKQGQRNTAISKAMGFSLTTAF